MKIHLIGDSIVKEYGSESENFIGGWGEHLQYYFKENEVQVFDYAIGGRSTRSFLNEGRFFNKEILSLQDKPIGLGPAFDQINKGDFVFIEFGHNDDDSKINDLKIERLVPLGEPDESGIYPTVVPNEKMLTKDSDAVQYGGIYFSYECGATYKGFLKLYVDSVRKKGAIPILVTPVARQFYENGKIQAIPGHHGGTDRFGEYTYVRAMEQLANEEQVILIDLFHKTKSMFEMLGETDSLFLQSIKDSNEKVIGDAGCGAPAKWVEEYDQYMEQQNFERFDLTHQNRYGSYLVTAHVVEEMFALLEKDAFSLSIPVEEKDAFQALGQLIQTICSKTVLAPAKLSGRLPEIKHIFQYVKLP